ncbi:MAG: hypothetical protein FWD94_05385 [Treponema sp.]|nr:hypothetical protein [Treponema sp.]
MSKVHWQQLLLSGCSPKTLLSGSVLLVVAGGRLAHALPVLLALVWVFVLSSLAGFFASRFFPKSGGGRPFLSLFLASFFAGAFLLLLWMAFPLVALQVFFPVAFVPVLYMISGIGQSGEGGRGDLIPELWTSLAAALPPGICTVLLALIREPAGLGSLSLPGGAHGLLLFYPFGPDAPAPLRLLAGSAGALFLCGYLLALFRHFREKFRKEGNDD